MYVSGLQLECNDTKPVDYIIVFIDVHKDSSVSITPYTIDQFEKRGKYYQSLLEQLCKAYPSINIELTSPYLEEAYIKYKNLDIRISGNLNNYTNITVYGGLAYKDVPFALRILRTVKDVIEKLNSSPP
jgi:hypothetical protein